MEERRRECVREALDILKHYNNVPFVDAFKKKYGGMPREGVELRCEALLHYIDQLKMWGKQHVFLFSLRRGEEHYRHDLADPGYIQGKLRQLDLEGRYEADICKWEAEEPYLVDVRYEKNRDNRVQWLVYKWVETRRFKVWEGDTLVDKEERSVNFFIVDLLDGTAELRLQSLKARPGKKLHEEYDLYIAQLKRLLDIRLFSIFSLVPIMKRFLYKYILPITNWSIKSITGNLRGSVVNPTLMEKLKLPFINFFPQEMTLFWECRQFAHNKGRLYFSMNGYNNAVTFNSITDKSKVDFILSNLRSRRAGSLEYYKIKMKELKILRDNYPDDSRMIFLIDYNIREMKARELNSAELAAESGYDESRFAAVFLNAAALFPRRFSVVEGKGHWILKIRYILHDGFIERIMPNVDDPKSSKKARVAKYMTGIPLLFFIRKIFAVILAWYVQNQLEASLGIPLIVLEVLTHFVVMSWYYGGKRTYKLFARIPKFLMKKLIRSVLSQEYMMTITPRAYKKWFPKKKDFHDDILHEDLEDTKKAGGKKAKKIKGRDKKKSAGMRV
jgi:hypothetical protein